MLGLAFIDCDSAPFREPRLLLWLESGIADASPCSLNAAATAAVAVLEADALTLFRRLTRWEGFVAVREMECECCLEVVGCRGKLPETGREVGGSCVGHDGQSLPMARRGLVYL